MEIVSRAEWSARPPRYRTLIATPTAELWLHHTAGALDAGGNGVFWDDMQGIQDFHMDDRGWSDIAYSYLIADGRVWEGRGAGVAGGHTKGRNTVSHAICVVGHYDHMKPQAKDLEAVAQLIAHGRRQGWWGDLTGPHRDAPGAATSCCGKHLIARIPDIERRTQALLANPDPLLEEDDMIPELIKAVYNLARRKSPGDFYDVAVEDPGGYAYHLAGAASASDPVEYVRSKVAAPLAKASGRKINLP